MALRPLSQTGLIRVPQNPNQRVIDPDTGKPRKRWKLRQVNRLMKLNWGVYLTPTKGFRAV